MGHCPINPHTVLTIDGVPALIWGAASPSVIITVHGHLAVKTDTTIALFVTIANHHSCQTLSFDPPNHDVRMRNRATMHDMTLEEPVNSLQEIMNCAQAHRQHVGLIRQQRHHDEIYFSYPRKPNRKTSKPLFGT